MTVPVQSPFSYFSVEQTFLMWTVSKECKCMLIAVWHIRSLITRLLWVVIDFGTFFVTDRATTLSMHFMGWICSSNEHLIFCWNHLFTMIARIIKKYSSKRMFQVCTVNDSSFGCKITHKLPLKPNESGKSGIENLWQSLKFILLIIMSGLSRFPIVTLAFCNEGANSAHKTILQQSRIRVLRLNVREQFLAVFFPS